MLLSEIVGKNVYSGKAVRHQTLTLTFVGSNPATPAIKRLQKRYLALKPRCQRGFRAFKGLEISSQFRRYKMGVLPL